MPTRRRMHRIGAHMTATAATAEYLAVGLTTRARRSPSAGVGAEPERRPQTVVEHWAPRETAIIVCDMWDLHHCLNATRRGAELCPRMEQMLVTLRTAGVTVIHSPSGAGRTGSCRRAAGGHRRVATHLSIRATDHRDPRIASTEQRPTAA